MITDAVESKAWSTLRERLPAAAHRLARTVKLEKDLQHKTSRKRRLSTLQMLGPLQAPLTLRVFIHHSYSDTSKSQSGGHRGGKKVPSWTLCIEGGILEDGKISPNYHFSQFFDSINISFDRRVSKVTAQDIEWVRPSQGYVRETDGFETTQMGVQDAYVRISFHRRSEVGPSEAFSTMWEEKSPFLARRRMTPELTKLLKLRREERLDVIETTFVELIRTRLYPEAEPGWFTCDTDFRRLFGLERFHISGVSELLAGHLSQADPVFMDYEVSNETVDSKRMVDLTVEPPSGGGLQTHFNAIVQSGSLEKEIEQKCRLLDRRAAYIGERLVEKAKRIAALRSIADDPSKGLVQLASQHDHASQVLAEDSASTMPDIIEILRRKRPDISSSFSAPSAAAAALSGGTGGVNGEPAMASSRWLSDAIQQYLSQQAVVPIGKQK